MLKDTLKDIVIVPPFLTNFGVDMANFMDLHKMIGKSAFLSLFKCTKWKWMERCDKKWKVETSIFTSGRGFEFTKDV